MKLNHPTALKSEVIFDVFHVKPHCLFIHLWLINVVSELKGGQFVLNTHFSSLALSVAVEAVTVCASVSSGTVELSADGLL